MRDATSPRAVNRLAGEKSPYLLQHAHNPVDWYPWGDEAFARAAGEQRPIFLSIGYSTCHWCHVMERESFENDEVAALLNDGFVCIKVDREERPDVDRVYMAAMQTLGMGGGWPLTVFLTPAREPFFGGTYFPPRAVRGHAGLIELLPRALEAWRGEREALVDTGRQVLQALAAGDRPTHEPAPIGRLLAAAVDALERMRDPVHGGFGDAPKFPSPSNLVLLLRAWDHDRHARASALETALAQLDAMAAGGIHDPLGGGFHRYATDRSWRTPHFEKMLYDQAQLAWCALEAYQATGEARHAALARDILDYVVRDLTLAGGGFASAEDADSEGFEGTFYVWTPAQLEAALGAADAALFATRYGVTARGNFEHGTSVLYEAATLAETAAAHGCAPDEAAARLTRARATLLATRAHRARPHRDDKVLTAWNGLMISAFARAAQVLGDPALAAPAEHAAGFAWTHLVREDGARVTLARRWRDGEAAGRGQLDDHADLALGLLDLALATGSPRWLARATRVAEAMLAGFEDREHGGFYDSPADDPTLALRMKDGFDGAELAGNSVAALVLWRLAALLDREDFRAAAERSFRYHAGRLATHPLAMPMMLVAMDRAAHETRHVVIVGDPAAADTRMLLDAFRSRFLPHDDLLAVGDATAAAAFAEVAPFVAPLTTREGRAAAYVCVERTCRLPVTDAAAFGASLDARTERRAGDDSTGGVEPER